MAEYKLISPLLDSFAMGDPVSEHNGVRCCPAMDQNTKDKYIVKIISIPASQTKLDALLLTGAYPSPEAAALYFKDLADDIEKEVQTLSKLSKMEGFIPYSGSQIVPMDNGTGYNVYLLGTYKKSLSKFFSREPMTHLRAINLGLDLCAALAVCRRSGYLYADLKPENVYITENNEYRIGDLGFIKLSSLKYASLPELYRSKYTAPEIADAFSSLNETIDIYALGLILYQAYNGGTLPFVGDNASEEPFEAPAYADYEMAEIILKACAPDPKNRWQDPTEMGQALVSYMQRNGANDTPIVVGSTVAHAVSAVTEDLPISESGTSKETEAVENDVPSEDSEPKVVSKKDIPSNTTEHEEITDEPASENPAETPVYTEDDFGNLSLLDDVSAEDLLSDQEMMDISYQDVSDEVSQMLSMADDLMAHPVPAADIVTPDPVEVPIPEPISIDEPTKEESADTSETVVVDVSEAKPENIEPEPETEERDIGGNAESLDEDDPEPFISEKRSRRAKVVIRYIIAALILAIIIAGGYLFYRYYYIQTIDDIAVRGQSDQLTVYLQGNADETILVVSCSDDYGNRLTADVVSGKAEFTGLLPNTRYTIRVDVEGFHGIKGVTTTTYNSPAQTSIQSFTAITGSEDGSAILSFTVSSPDNSSDDPWQVHYWADGEEKKAVSFTGHTVTLTGLTVGKEYTIQLVPEESIYVVGTDTITFVAQKLVYAHNLTISSIANNSLTAVWDAPEGTQVASWKVHCFNSDGTYNETVVVTDTTVTFENLDHTDSYTVEVLADGMTVSQRANIAENSITVTDLAADTSNPGIIVLTWQSSTAVPSDGWLVKYKMQGVEAEQTVFCKENVLVITDAVPGSTYSFIISASSNYVICDEILCQTPEAQLFSCSYDNFPVTAEDIVFRMCRTPEIDNWTRHDLKSGDYTTEFNRGEKASFTIRLTKVYGFSNDPITILYVIRDENDSIVSIESAETTWNDLWDMYYGTIDIPSIPAVAGNYTLTMYFNAAFATEQEFTVLN